MINYGGQAVLEGVMMRGSKAMAVSVRDPRGNIITHTEPLNQKVYGSKIARLPFVRGLTLLWDALGLGVKALMFSAEVSIEDEESADESAEKRAADAKAIFDGPAQIGTVLMSLAMAIGLFIALPAFLSGLIEGWLGVESAVAANLIEGMIRLAITVGYIAALGLVPEFRRLFGYHGAEHKTINAFEADAPMTPESVARFPVEHPRCGTAFLLTVIVASIIIYTFLPQMSILLRVISRLLLVPLIAGIAYEFLRFTAKYRHNPIVRAIIIPNLALQRLTTREPDMQMLEVAITSFQEMLACENDAPEMASVAVEVKAVPGIANQ